MKKRFLCLSLIFAMTLSQIVPVAAARKDEIKAEQTETQNKLSQAQSREAELEDQKNALMSEINTLDQKLVSVMAQIDILNGDIEDKEAAIVQTKEDLAKAEADRDERYESMKKRIQSLYEKGGTNAWAQMILDSDGLAGMLTKAEYTEKLYNYDRDELQKLKDTVQEVTDLGNQLAQEKGELEEMKQAQEDQQKTLQASLDEKKSTASDYENQIASIRSQADQYRNLIEQQNQELQAIQEEERRQAEEARKAEEARQAEEAARQQAAAKNQASEEENNSQSEDNTTPVSTGGNESQTGNNQTDNTDNTDSTDSTDEPENTGGSTQEPEEPQQNTGSNSSSESSGSSGGSYSATGEAVVAYASQFIGNPYVYGGNSMTNGIDCSAFVQQVFGHFGYSLPRVSDDQASSGRGISYSEARAGDIIVYPGHVAILAGDGGIVHASNSQPYPQGGIKYSPNALYRSYIAVRRIIE